MQPATFLTVAILASSLAIVAADSDVSFATVKVPAWQQCGGENYQGPTDCEEGFQCQETDGPYMSQCVQLEAAETSPRMGVPVQGVADDLASIKVPAWQQCGGENYQGPTDCEEGFQCTETDGSYMSQCVQAVGSASVSKDAPTAKDLPVNNAVGDMVKIPGWQQCGGTNYAGPTTCEVGFVCQETDGSYLSQCVQVESAEASMSTNNAVDKPNNDDDGDDGDDDGDDGDDDGGDGDDDKEGDASSSFASAKVPAWQQCGGDKYQGPTACEDGFVCQETDGPYMSQCVQAESGGSATKDAPANSSLRGAALTDDFAGVKVAAWQQCGGQYYAGPTTCEDGFECKATDEEGFSQCIAA
ncbi:Aste57867_19268 [Aphanomyces stellatus]|uniref:Aste57867_19268 protein n=1 Tax=Aphanomyces stellatus TaxID=120398 RepID=A0A485LC47_9STRA|nr:hypothetical protein As57867_019204 [Aphanomyces stellatus]VFT95988.1 Aste57867_19268 [Aphanomyces stellatus]